MSAFTTVSIVARCDSRVCFFAFDAVSNAAGNVDGSTSSQSRKLQRSVPSLSSRQSWTCTRCNDFGARPHRGCMSACASSSVSTLPVVAPSTVIRQATEGNVANDSPIDRLNRSRSVSGSSHHLSGFNCSRRAFSHCARDCDRFGTMSATTLVVFAVSDLAQAMAVRISCCSSLNS